MLSRFSVLAAIAVSAGAAMAALPAPPAPSAVDPDLEVDFQRDVRPILADNCFACHGPDEESRQLGLRLDTRAGATEARRRGAAVVPGDVAKSLLIQRIEHSDPRRRMPPEAANKTVSASELDTLKRWIEVGAPWDEHWSFQPIRSPELPEVARSSWVRQPLDRFVLRRLEKEGLEPAEEADRRTLARRVALDLTGLPPDPGTLEAFVADESENAYETLVDQLLVSKHWGEHRARYWLDAARYADTHGFHIDNYREMWAYRDWVIDAFNANQPFDEFTTWQIAGDLLPDPTLEQLVATGFQRNNITTNEGGVVPAEYEAIYAKDRAETIGDVYLGLTVGCATCHDHKFDPIPQREFYALTAFWGNTTQYVMDGNVSDPPPVLVVPRPEDREQWEELRSAAREVDESLASAQRAPGDGFAAWRNTPPARPLDAESEVLALDLSGDEPSFVHDGTRHPLLLHADEGKSPPAVAPGPLGLPALRFAKGNWAELPNLPWGEGDPFSLSLWVYSPEGEESYTVLSQRDPADGNRGWAATLGARLFYVRLVGEKAGYDQGRSSTAIGTINSKRHPTGTWAHFVFTHDGSGERAGQNLFRNGLPIEKEGSQTWAKVLGSIETTQPLLLGRRAASGDSEPGHFDGGGIADLRVFDRELSAQEALVLAQWGRLQPGAPSLSEEQLADSVAPRERRELAAVDPSTESPPFDTSSAALERARVLQYLVHESEPFRSLLARKHELEKEWREVRRRGSVTHVMQESSTGEAAAHVLYRGMYDQPRERVLADVPSVLPPFGPGLPRNRMGLAQWLMAPENPLTARVTVNRFWQQIFGRGLVPSAADFGAQGDVPSHPDLLDHLATQFRASGWDTKAFFKSLVTSATYRQAATLTPTKVERDPDNVLLSRGPRFRMDGEMLRDTALAASGLLVRTLGGPSVKPYQPDGVWSSVAMGQSNTRKYVPDSGDKLYRRSLYTFWKRAAPPASMTIFNAPSREHAAVKRERTNTPLQALVTMNDTQFVEAARVLAQRAMREAGPSFDRRLDYVTTRLVSRPFEGAEREVAERTLDGLLDLYGSDEVKAAALLAVGEFPHDAALPTAESAAWTMLTNQLMNLDEVLNK